MVIKKALRVLMALVLVFILGSLLVLSAGCDNEEDEILGEVPLPWTDWEAIDGAVKSTVSLSENATEAVYVESQWAFLMREVELDDLTWDYVDGLVEEMGAGVYEAMPGWDVEWTTLPSVTLEPGGEVTFDIPIASYGEFYEPWAPLDGGYFAVITRYTVALASEPDEIVARVVNEASFPGGLGGVNFVGTLSNFDVHNNTGQDADNFDMTLSGVKYSDVTGWYGTGNPYTWSRADGSTIWYGGWGASPSFEEKSDGSLGIVWKDTDNPIKHCHWVHFGLELKESATPGNIQAHWTQSPQETWWGQWWILAMAIAVAIATAVAWALRGRRLPQLLAIALVPGIFVGVIAPVVIRNIFGPNIFIAVPIAILIAIAVTLISFLFLSLVIPKKKSGDSSSQKALVETIILLIEELGEEIEKAEKELKDTAEKQKNMTEKQKKEFEEKKKKLEEQKKKLKKLEERKISLFLKKLEKELDTVEDEVTEPPEEGEPEETSEKGKPAVTPGEGESQGTE